MKNEKRRLHVVLMSEISHRTIEECTAGEVEKGTGVFAVRDDDQIESTMLEEGKNDARIERGRNRETLRLAPGKRQTPKYFTWELKIRINPSVLPREKVSLTPIPRRFSRREPNRRSGNLFVSTSRSRE